MTESVCVVRVATVSQDGLVRERRDELLDGTFERMDQAAACRPDVLCLPEGFSGPDGEPVPGPVTERVADWARQQHCWVLCSIKTLVNGVRFNSTVILDREGSLRGRYDKIHPTEGEIAAGVRPGPLDPPVFQTDFGPVGVQICFDVNWPDGWRRLRDKGARIVFFAAAYPAHRQLAALAQTCEYYVVSSTRTRPSRIYDITGTVLAQSGFFCPWTAATLLMDKRLFEIDGHVGKVRRIERKYGPRVEVKWYHDEDWFTLASLDPELRLQDIMDEFEMVPLTDYIARSGALQDRARQ